MDVSDYPDFSSHGYQVTRELGRNREAGRITYLATAQNLDQQVVIKEFRFALADSSWSGFKAYQREIEVLQQLEHPRIPRYLDSFETQVGFCLVQEYKNAPSLVERRSFNPEDIKQIALSVLEILVYLQRRTPPIIHRDIKPENILVDKQLNAYLVDFGFARIRGGEMALSSVVAGTLGFMPPEEQFGRPLTEASDLYSLGATLICLLTGTRSVDIGTLIDDDYRFDFKALVPQLSASFISWLEKMVAPNVKQRFDNATVALEALKSNRVVGSANGRKSLVGVVKSRKQRAVLGLATLGVLAGVGTTLISQQASPVKQLLKTKQCKGCNLRDAKLEGAKLEGAKLEGADLALAKLTGADLANADLEGADLALTNLTGADLTGADLGNANLTGAYLALASLDGADLGNANLTGADLEGAYLGNADLKDANLTGADLGSANLTGADLEGAYLGNANLTGADLGSANLTGASLANANLKGANLKDADLKDANLKGASLEGASLEGANLKGAYLRGADLRAAYLSSANLSSADLSSADLRSAYLRGANLRDADLTGADLGGADLSSANLRDADLTGADLGGAKLRGADLSSANLRDADLRGANLKGANLRSADLRDAKLSSADLSSADLEGAIMPDGTKHP